MAIGYDSLYNYYAFLNNSDTVKQKFTSIINGQILITHSFGQWNERHALQFSTHVKKQVKGFNQQPFGHLLYFDEWQLAGPETIPVIRDTISWLVNNGMRCAAEIFHPDALKAYLLDNMVAESRERFDIHRFDNDDDGLAWLESYGFRLETPLSFDTVP
ncbi:hypothetical protein [Alteromonas sp. H39]|uniref:hypothetical protein n=1 Tax=Alteromonas sp. H39 TaxID=3389876 RepID=UPI0039E16054